MAATLRVGNAMFCEYVTRGEGGKFILINVFSGDILVSAFPAPIVGSLYFEFYPGDRKDLHAKLEFFRGDVKTFETITLFLETKASEPAIINTGQFVVQCDGPLSFHAILTIKGFKPAFLLKKEIRLANPLPTA